MDIEILFDIFKVAIDKERAAYDFYLEAAAGASDSDIKKLFGELAVIELEHQKKLEKKYKELRENLNTE